MAKRLEIVRNKKFIALTLFILLGLISFLLRSKAFLAGDFFFLPDQARDFILVRDMILNLDPPLIGARAMSGGYIFHGPLWIWFLGIPFFIFKGNPLFISWSYLIISLFIVFCAVFAAYKLYGTRISLFAMLFMTISSMLVGSVSAMTNAHIMPLVFIPYLFFFIKYLRGDKTAFYFAAFFAGLGVQFEGIFAVPIFLFLLLVSLFTDRYILHIRRILLTAVFFFVPLTTFFLFDLRHDFLMARGLFRLLTDTTGLGVLPGYEQYADVGFRISDRVVGLFSLPSFVMFAYHIVLHIAFLGVLLAAIWLMYKGKDKQQKKEFFILLLLPVFIYTLYMYFQYPIWKHYIYSLALVGSFIFSLAFNTVSKTYWGKWVVGGIVCLLVVPVLSSLTKDYITKPHVISTSDGSYKNQLAVADYIFQNARAERFGYFVYAPQVFTYGMDYLLWWIGTEKYGYVPDSKKQRIFYLIMYPPLKGDDGAHDFWITNVIRTQAKVVERKVFPGNIIVEKRMLEKGEEPVDQNYYLNIR